MPPVLTAAYHDWNVAIHCSPANAGFFRSIAFVRAPAAGEPSPSTLLETPGNFYPSALLSNQAAMASARRFIDAAESQLDPHKH